MPHSPSVKLDYLKYMFRIAGKENGQWSVVKEPRIGFVNNFRKSYDLNPGLGSV